MIPGAMMPPRYSRLELIALNVVAVPKSTTIHGAPYFDRRNGVDDPVGAELSKADRKRIFRPVFVVWSTKPASIEEVTL
jgi:hypothetical protein